MATAFLPAEVAVEKPLAGVNVVILAGGLGTRLRSVLPDRQKVMADVEGQPFLGRLIGLYARAGAKRIVLALGYRSSDVEEFISRFQEPVELIASIEAEPLGTGGALRLALAHIESKTVLVSNGNPFAAVDLSALRDLHAARDGAITLALAEVSDASRYGRVAVDDRGAVTSFAEKAQGQSGSVNAGVYLVERSVIAQLPSGRAISLERDVFPQWIGRGLYALHGNVPFIDIGTPELWAAADAFFAGLEARKGKA